MVASSALVLLRDRPRQPVGARDASPGGYRVRALARQGFDIHEATNGLEVLKFLETERPDERSGVWYETESGLPSERSTTVSDLRKSSTRPRGTSSENEPSTVARRSKYATPFR